MPKRAINKCNVCRRRCANGVKCEGCLVKLHFRCANVDTEKDIEEFQAGEKIWQCLECKGKDCDKREVVERTEDVDSPKGLLLREHVSDGKLEQKQGDKPSVSRSRKSRGDKSISVEDAMNNSTNSGYRPRYRPSHMPGWDGGHRPNSYIHQRVAYREAYREAYDQTYPSQEHFNAPMNPWPNNPQGQGMFNQFSPSCRQRNPRPRRPWMNSQTRPPPLLKSPGSSSVPQMMQVGALKPPNSIKPNKTPSGDSSKTPMPEKPVLLPEKNREGPSHNQDPLPADLKSNNSGVLAISDGALVELVSTKESAVTDTESKDNNAEVLREDSQSHNNVPLPNDLKSKDSEDVADILDEARFVSEKSEKESTSDFIPSAPEQNLLHDRHILGSATSVVQSPNHEPLDTELSSSNGILEIVAEPEDAISAEERPPQAQVSSTFAAPEQSPLPSKPSCGTIQLNPVQVPLPLQGMDDISSIMLPPDSLKHYSRKNHNPPKTKDDRKRLVTPATSSNNYIDIINAVAGETLVNKNVKRRKVVHPVSFQIKSTRSAISIEKVKTVKSLFRAESDDSSAEDTREKHRRSNQTKVHETKEQSVLDEGKQAPAENLQAKSSSCRKDRWARRRESTPLVNKPKYTDSHCNSDSHSNDGHNSQGGLDMNGSNLKLMEGRRKSTPPCTISEPLELKQSSACSAGASGNQERHVQSAGANNTPGSGEHRHKGNEITQVLERDHCNIQSLILQLLSAQTGAVATPNTSSILTDCNISTSTSDNKGPKRSSGTLNKAADCDHNNVPDPMFEHPVKRAKIDCRMSYEQWEAEGKPSLGDAMKRKASLSLSKEQPSLGDAMKRKPSLSPSKEQPSKEQPSLGDAMKRKASLSLSKEQPSKEQPNLSNAMKRKPSLSPSQEQPSKEQPSLGDAMKRKASLSPSKEKPPASRTEPANRSSRKLTELAWPPIPMSFKKPEDTRTSESLARVSKPRRANIPLSSPPSAAGSVEQRMKELHETGEIPPNLPDVPSVPLAVGPVRVKTVRSAKPVGPVLADTVKPALSDTLRPVSAKIISPILADTAIPVSAKTIGPALSDTLRPISAKIVSPVLADTAKPVSAKTIGPALSDTLIPVSAKIVSPVLADTAKPVSANTIGPALSDTLIPVSAKIVGPVLADTLRLVSAKVITDTVPPVLTKAIRVITLIKKESEAECIDISSDEDVQEIPEFVTPTPSKPHTPVSSAVESRNPVSPAVESRNPVSPAVESRNPVSSAIEPRNPVSSAIEPRNPVSSAIEPRNPVSSAIEPRNPASSAIEPRNPVSSAIEPRNPVSSAIESRNPVSSAIEPRNPVSSAIEPRNPVSSAIESRNPVSSAIEPRNPVSSAIEPRTPVSSAVGNPSHSNVSLVSTPRLISDDIVIPPPSTAPMTEAGSIERAMLHETSSDDVKVEPDNEIIDISTDEEQDREVKVNQLVVKDNEDPRGSLQTLAEHVVLAHDLVAIHSRQVNLISQHVPYPHVKYSLMQGFNAELGMRLSQTKAAIDTLTTQVRATVKTDGDLQVLLMATVNSLSGTVFHSRARTVSQESIGHLYTLLADLEARQPAASWPMPYAEEPGVYFGPQMMQRALPLPPARGPALAIREHRSTSLDSGYVTPGEYSSVSTLNAGLHCKYRECSMMASIRCFYCVQNLYCSVDHLMLDWVEKHSNECTRQDPAHCQ